MATVMEASADYCEDLGGVVICGTRMKEYRRTWMGLRWCFTCRKRHGFWWRVDAPVGLSYYGPTAYVLGRNSRCSDLFPGWTRGYEEDE